MVDPANSRWNWPYKLSSAAALSAGILFLVAIIDLILTVLQPGAINGWLSLIQNNWLVVIYKLHAGFNGVHSSLLYQQNLLDMIILALVATMYIGLYRSLRGTSKTWSFIAMAQPFLAILLFIVTKTAGRSGVMGAALVISVVMLRSQLYNKLIAYIGILSAILLLSGDFGVSLAPSNILAILTGTGYVLMMTWFFLVARRLYQLGLGN
jgi:hypothetical protein